MSYKSISLGVNIDHVATLRQARRGEERHEIRIRAQAHRLPRRRHAARLDPAAHFGAVELEVDHGLHSHRLHHVQGDRKRPQLAALIARVRDVLGAQAEH